jgi:hypothetical protein
MHPQLRLMLGGAILVVQFGDAIAFCSRGLQPSVPTLPIGLILILHR